MSETQQDSNIVKCNWCTQLISGNFYWIVHEDDNQCIMCARCHAKLREHNPNDEVVFQHDRPRWTKTVNLRKKPKPKEE